MFWQRSVSSLSSWRRRFHPLAPLRLCPPAPPLQTAVRELTLLSLSAVSWGAIALPAAALCPGQLGTAIDLVIARPEMARARLGIQVSTLDGERVYGRDSDRFFVPASTLKLLTTAAVLTQLGPDAQIRTSVYGETAVNGLTTLRVVGRGDPSFSTDDITALGDQLQAQGIQQVSQLIGDESAFPGSATNPNWEWEDVQAGYGAPVNALILNENEIGLTLTPQAVGQPLQVVWDNPTLAATWLVANQSRTVAAGSPEFISVGRDLGQPVLRVAGQLVAGSQPASTAIAVFNPGEAFVMALRDDLQARGIAVGALTVTQRPSQSTAPELAAVVSPRLADLLIPTNQQSNNLYAEALLKQLGYPVEAEAEATAAGITVAEDILANLGVNLDQVVMVDGSGLARKNLVTPEALVTVLAGMARSPHATIYRNSLAVAGRSGTLRNRWRDTPVEGRLWGKSGAISRNFALAGYLEPDNHEPVAFAILINNIDQRGRVARGIIDDLVLVLSELEACG
jgi:D-alanyl-D-alanine carboxypeptidase/D-alanyl-D-alanine-endopeptidase (penicillin-binding protein 4)